MQRHYLALVESDATLPFALWGSNVPLGYCLDFDFR